MGDFEIDTRLVQQDETNFRANLSKDWAIWGPNGGYVAAIALRAVGLVSKVGRPATFAGHFLSVAEFEAVDVCVTPIKVGRRSESFRVAITQKGRPVFEGIARTAAAGAGLEHDVSVMPGDPPPSKLRDIKELVPEGSEPPFPFWNNFQVKPIWPERMTKEERVAHAPIFREWFRFIPRSTFDDPFLDAGRCLLMIDTASWIAACQPHPNGPFIAPNIDVTAWFHQFEPSCEWLLTDTRCDVASAGLMGTHARIWSETGKLLATGGAQLMCVPAPAQP